MRLVVDMTKCQSYAQCCFLAPGSFSFQGQEALVYDPAPDDRDRLKILQAAAACPVQAIVLDRADDTGGADDTAAADDTGAAGAPSAAVTDAGSAVEAPAGSAALGADRHVVVVGASLAGFRTAEAVRREGFTGRLTVIGDEPDEPYDRPPLSKQVLLGTAGSTTLPRRIDVGAEWRLGVAASRLDRTARQVHLADGRIVGYDRLVIATGTRARPWPDPLGAALGGVVTLRTGADARALRALLADRPARVLVIGGGFTGSEVASVCRDLELPVTQVVRGAAPLAGAFGTAIGDVAAQVTRDADVDLRCEVTVTGLEGDAVGRVRRARLSDGSVVDAEVVVVATGAVRNVEWLAGSGLCADDRGVVCDETARAVDLDGVATDDIVVAGDIASFPHPLFGPDRITTEHWGNAVEQAEVAAHTLVTGPDGRRTHDGVPVFWSIQFHHVVRAVGVPALGDEVMVVQGSTAARSFVALYGLRGRLVGAVAWDQGRWLEHYRRMIAVRAPFPVVEPTLDPAADRTPRPAGTSQRRAEVVA